jgi:TPR repeat protein
MPDSDKAIKWYQKAAEQGHKQAAKALKKFI